ncbi:MAG: HPr family phosphocarrier protein [Clostridia bacterium]|nr:HPr family phosphocarrier protein [Clostridia bacterium]
MLTKSFEITCPVGLHARPASILVSVAQGFKSSILIKYQDKEVPANSLIGVMTLGAETGQSVEVTISGEDEEKAMERLEAFFEKELKDL